MWSIRTERYLFLYLWHDKYFIHYTLQFWNHTYVHKKGRAVRKRDKSRSLETNGRGEYKMNVSHSASTYAMLLYMNISTYMVYVCGCYVYQRNPSYKASKISIAGSPPFRE